MTLFEKFNWDTPLAGSLSDLPGSYPDSTAPNFKELLWSYRITHNCAATCAILIGDRKTARSSAKEYIKAAIDHFHGEWRRNAKIQSNQPRWKPYDWFSVGPDALFWAAICDDWKAVQLLSQFPCIPPKWDWPDHAYFSLLAFFLRGESLEQHASIVDFILGKKKQQPKLLLDCLMEISRCDTAKFQKAWERYLDYFLKHERNKGQLTLLQSRNASFYAALAGNRGLALKIPAKFEDYIVQSL